MLPIEYQNFFNVWKKQIWIFAVLAFAYQAVVQQLNPFMISIVMLPLYFLLTKGMMKRYYSRPFSEGRVVTEIFAISLLIRVAEVFILAFIFQQFNGMPFMSDHDDFNYHHSMLDIYGYWQEYGVTAIQSSNIRFSTGMYAGFPYFGAFMMKIFGPNVYAARLGNAIASAVTVLVVRGIVSNYADRMKTIFTTLLFTFSPILTVFAACNLKDTMLLLCILTSVWGLTNIILKRRWLVSFIALLASISFMIFCRPASIFILLLGSNVFFFFRVFNFKHSNVLFLTNMLALVAALMIWKYCNDLELTTDYETFWETNLDAAQRTIAEDSKAGISNLSIAKMLTAPIFAISSPFLPPATLAIFESKEVTINYTFHGMLAYFSLLPMMIFGALQALRHWKYQPIPFFLLTVCALYKFAQANSLLTILSPRQSLPAMALLMLMIPVGMDRFFNRRKFVFFVDAIAIAVLLAFNVYRSFF